MKYLKLTMLIAIIMALTSSCGHSVTHESNSREAAEAGSKVSPRVEVLYFHSKQRCRTCRAIERYAKEAVDSCFGGNNAVSFRTVDITTAEGERLADKYEISSSALLIINTADGGASHQDMTQYAFRNARKNTSEFKHEIEEKVEEYLTKV